MGQQGSGKDKDKEKEKEKEKERDKRDDKYDEWERKDGGDRGKRKRLSPRTESLKDSL